MTNHAENTHPEIIPHETASSPRRSKFGSLFKFIAIASGFSICLVIGLLHTQWAFDSLIYPKIGEALGGEFIVDSTTSRPLYSIQLKGVSYTDENNQESTIAEMHLRYNPLWLFVGQLDITEVLVKNVKLSLDSFLIDNKKTQKENITPTEQLYIKPFIGLGIDKLKLENIHILSTEKSFQSKTPFKFILDEAELSLEKFNLNSGGIIKSHFKVITEQQDRASDSLSGSVESKITLTPDAKEINVSSDVKLSEVTSNNQYVSIDNGNIELSSDVTIAKNYVNLALNKLFIGRLDGSEKFLEGAGNFKFSPSFTPQKLEIKNTSIDSGLATLLPTIESPIKSGILLLDLKGSYKSLSDFSLGGSIKVQDLLIDNSSQADHNPTNASLDLNLRAENGSFELEPSELQLENRITSIGSIQFTGKLKDYKELLVKVSSDKLFLEGITALIPQSRASSKSSGDSKSESFKLPSFPWDLDLDLDANNLIYKDIEVVGFEPKISYKGGTLNLPQTQFKINEAPALLKIDSSKTASPFLFEVENLDIFPIARSLNSKIKDDLSGKITKLRLVTNLQHSKQLGDFRVTLQDLKVPAYLQNTPPLNLLFLPIDALQHTVGSIGGALLPSAITDLTSGINSSLKESGHIVFDEAQIRANIFRDSIELEDTMFNGNILPNIHFDGSIGFNQSLDLNIGIEILKIPVPLPVAGTLSTPIPNLITFTPQVVKSLGLGLVNIGGMFVDEDESEFFKEDAPEVSNEPLG